MTIKLDGDYTEVFTGEKFEKGKGPSCSGPVTILS